MGCDLHGHDLDWYRMVLKGAGVKVVDVYSKIVAIVPLYSRSVAFFPVCRFKNDLKYCSLWSDIFIVAFVHVYFCSLFSCIFRCSLSSGLLCSLCYVDPQISPSKIVSKSLGVLLSETCCYL